MWEGLKHLKGSASTNFTKLEKFLAQKGEEMDGPYMCGRKPMSGDFMLWEMLDQHKLQAEAQGINTFLDAWPRLKNLWEAMKQEPSLQEYFSSEMYGWPLNNPLAANWTGREEGFV